jgi:GT2 family glycosyltransferase
VLTVFIATHNGAATLPRVLAAYTKLIAPSGAWKLVLIDNVSDDTSGAIAQSFAGRLPLVLRREARRGKNRALNSGLCELAGDLAVFSDDDTVPEPDWLVRLRTAADQHQAYGIFGGRIVPRWDIEPDEWIREWVPAAPVFSATEATRTDGPCEPTKIWGPNMAIRAECFARGHRFDERIGPDGSAIYAMGGETELTLRLAIAEQIECWHCTDARVHHIITARKMTRGWILQRAFNLGRCLRREALQHAAAGRPHWPRDAAAISAALARELRNLDSARRAADERGMFAARWQLNLWFGCVYEALAG